MTVPSQTTLFNESTANGLTTSFPYEFMIASADDLTVELDGVETTTGFTVTGVGDEGGGAVVFSVAPANGVTVLRYLDPVLNRETDYQELGDFPAGVVNFDFNRIWLAIQSIQARIGRAIKLPVATSDDQIINMDTTDRAGRVIGFDADGNLVALEGVSGTSLVDLAAPEGASLIGYDTGVSVGDAIDRISSSPDAAASIAGTPIVIVITGQSNARGANAGGPNPASSLVKTWDGITGAWGGSDYTALPWTRTDENGNAGNNNTALAFAHRLVAETGRPVYIIYDAVSGRPISDWVGSGTSSVRYAAIKSKVEAALATTELSGITTIDYLIWAQGEENALTDTMTAYLASFTTLDSQFRAESWMTETTPVLVMGMSGLHTRYQVWQAQIDYCANVNRNCIYVNSVGLKTVYDNTGSGDYTHFLGDSLWEHGYHRIWYALKERGMSHRFQPSPFYSRGSGPWRGESDAIALFSSLVSRESATSEFPFNGPAATGSISWGYQCSADGNYTMCGGYQVTNDNLTNYSFGWGRENTFDANGDYSGTFGYQNAVNATYGFAAGRGNTIADSGCTAVGTFASYTTTQTDPVSFQVGVGSSSGARANAFAVRKSGVTEHKTLTVATLPTAGTAGRRAFVTDANATTFASVVAAGGSNKVPVYDDGTNWRIG
jgi:hypothetical protein